MIKEIDSIDISPLVTAYQELEKDMVWYESADKQVNLQAIHLKRQTSLQYRESENPWISSVGRLRDNESLFNNLNPFFKDTIFETIINKYKLVRTRLMWVPQFSCYSMHKDQSLRLHIPLITNPDCYFVFKQGLIEHLQCGKVYSVNTTEYHTFINCSSSPRLHLMGVIT
jgi:hypothetical protein